MGGIDNLRFLRLVFSLTAVDKIFIPKNLKGNIFRGAFGLKFRELNCRSTPICSDRCVDLQCLYGKIFEPRYEGEGIPSGLKDIPRAFILTHTRDEREIINPGESFNIGFNLFGWSCDYYAHFIRTVEAIGEEGIGPLRGKFIVRSVWSEDGYGNRTLIKDEGGALKEVRSFSVGNNFQIESRFIKIEFLTPVNLIYEGERVNQPEFYHIFLRLRDRISAIAYFHHGFDLEYDYKYLELESREVTTVKSRWELIDVKRRSSRNHLLHDLGGVIGYAVYDFKSAERVELFAPWLKIGEIVNVGKNSVWGMGEMKTILNWKEKITEGRYVSRK